jgi:hypothetical protein
VENFTPFIRLSGKNSKQTMECSASDITVSHINCRNKGSFVKHICQKLYLENSPDFGYPDIGNLNNSKLLSKYKTVFVHFLENSVECLKSMN